MSTNSLPIPLASWLLFEKIWSFPGKKGRLKPQPCVAISDGLCSVLPLQFFLQSKTFTLIPRPRTLPQFDPPQRHGAIFRLFYQAVMTVGVIHLQR